MSVENSWDGVSDEIKKIVTPFLDEVKKGAGAPLYSAYLTGPASRNEFSRKNPEIDLLLVFGRVHKDLLDRLALMGRKFGARGVHAPLVLTPEYISNATDVFPIEFLDLANNHVHLFGERCFDGVVVSRPNLRLQCERELRFWRLQLRQGYLKAAGDPGWMSGWFIHHAALFFPVLRAVLSLLGGDIKAGNTETAQRVEKVTGIDTKPFAELWEARKSGGKIPKDKVYELFDRLDGALQKLVEKANGLE